MDAVLRKKINILIYLASADGNLDAREKKIINTVGVRNGIALSTIANLITAPESIGSLGALSHTTAVDYLTECILLMLVDGKVLPGEILFCQDVGIRLGFSKLTIDKLIDEIKENFKITYKDLHQYVLDLPHPSKDIV